MLTQAELKEILRYDSNTGVFVRLVGCGGISAGSIADSKSKHGYIKINVNCKMYYAHRLAFLYEIGRFPTYDVDHINGKKDDNRWCNLREATDMQNQMNRAVQRNNYSGFKGVTWCKRDKKYIARCTFNGRVNNLGYYNTPELASEAYNSFAIKHHGEFFNNRTKLFALKD